MAAPVTSTNTRHDPSQQYEVVLRRQTFARAYRMRTFYVLLSLSFSLLIVFKYFPIYGALIAFKNFNVVQGILGSPWNDFAYFKRLTHDPFFLRVLWNTFWLSVLRIVFAFPAPIILALLLNELRSTFYKRAVQTVSYLPHFMSWVVLGGIVKEILSPSRGVIGFLFEAVGLEPVAWLTNVRFAACWSRPGRGRASAGVRSSSWPRSPRSTRSCTRARRSTAPAASGKRHGALFVHDRAGIAPPDGSESLASSSTHHWYRLGRPAPSSICGLITVVPKSSGVKASVSPSAVRNTL